MKEIARFVVEDEIFDAIEAARCEIKLPTGGAITISRNEWVRNAIKEALDRQGVKIK